MTWYLYKQPSGMPDLTDYELNLALFPGYVLIDVYDQKPVVQGKKFNEFNKLVNADPTPQYVYDRKYSYPALGEQMDMLWHAMDDGTLPKVEPFYSQIKAVKEAHPKE